MKTKKHKAKSEFADGITVNQLAVQTGSTARAIESWLAQENVHFTTEGRKKLFDTDHAFDVVETRRAQRQESIVDSPYRRKVEAEAQRLERRNRIEQRLEERSYVKADDVEKVIRLVVQVLENIPNRVQSQYGLTPEQANGVQKLLDEARAEAANAVLQMGPNDDTAKPESENTKTT